MEFFNNHKLFMYMRYWCVVCLAFDNHMKAFAEDPHQVLPLKGDYSDEVVLLRKTLSPENFFSSLHPMLF